MAEPLEREIRHLRDLLFSPRDPEGRGFAPLADALRRAGDLGQALEVAQEGVHRLPNFSTGHVVTGWIHRARGEDGKAERAFRRVLELDDENVSALRGLGFLLAEGGEASEALEIFRRLDELDPGDSEVRARLLELGAGPEGTERTPREAGGPVMDIGTLAPEGAGGAVVDIGRLAPEGPADVVVEVDQLAPEGAEGHTVDAGHLAAAGGGDEVVDVGWLAPAGGGDEVVDVGRLA
ncbi:MAG TPA: tetratricopeptide repeat protein, partial [Longimicrobiales bacterium]|nr:tetratricopeptide repeat protein [Longimicrobiales bacterium]